MPIKKKRIITIGIIGINVLVFIWLSLFWNDRECGYMLETVQCLFGFVFGKSRILPINNQYVFAFWFFTFDEQYDYAVLFGKYIGRRNRQI